jgi:hypothetical protein
MRTSHLNGLLIVAISVICTVPLYALGQQADMAKLKANTRNVVGIISGDKAKSQTYCQVLDLSDELDQVDPHKDPKKAEDLSQKVDDLQKKLGPEYLAVLEALKDVDPDSKDGQEIASMLAMLDQSCPQ